MRKRLASPSIRYPLLLVLLTVLICIFNYSPGTWLTGWDTLHPEMDFGLNFTRLLQGVWRSEQGLGALAGHSHMADLPRVIILWVLHFVFATHMLRYLYIFLCLIIGPLGMYTLIQTLIPSAKTHKSIAFIGGLFYLFNLSTAQQFYAPFEMFPTQWAALPWTIWAALEYVRHPGRGWRNRYLWFFALITLLSTPQAYAAHLWYPFVVVFGLSVLLYSLGLQEKQSMQSVKKALVRPLILAVLLITVNGFWLFPNLYFIATGSSVPKEARQNRLFSQEYRIRNREDGYVRDVALMRGFYLNWSAYDFEKNRFGTLMPAWEKHLNNPLVSSIGYGAFALVAWGVIQSVRKKQRMLLAQLPYVIVPLVFLLNRTPPFEQLFDALLHLSLFEEASRFIFTKMSILQLMGYSIFFTYAVSLLYQTQFRKKGGYVLIGLLLCIYAFPIFQGQLIGRQFRIQIPAQYDAFWSFMKDREDGRVLTLPLHTISGWQYYDWGYQGAGFLWFNLHQPLLDRDFDRWNMHNEQSFREFQYAVYSSRTDLFTQSLQKYGVRYVVWDHSVITADPKNRRQMLFERETDALVKQLERNGDLVREAQFGTITVYTTRRLPPAQRIRAISSNVLPTYQWNWTDAAYAQLGDYVSSDTIQTPFTYYYPLRDITSSTDRITAGIKISDNSTTLGLQKDIKGTYLAPDLADTETVVFANVYAQKSDSSHILYQFEPLLPGRVTLPITYEQPFDFEKSVIQSQINTATFRTNTTDLTSANAVYLGQAYIYTTGSNIINGSPAVLPTDQLQLVPDDTNLTLPTSQQLFGPDQIVLTSSDRDNITVKPHGTGVVASFESQYTQNGSYLSMDDLPHNVGYILGITARNREGLPIRICLKNYYSDTCDVYDELSKSDTFTTDYFIIPPTDDGLGYGLSLDNISFGRAKTINEIQDIRITPLPYEYLSHARYRQESTTANTPGFFLDNSSYHPGWVAFATTDPQEGGIFTSLKLWFTGTPLSEHVLVNNWQNGWVLPSDTNTTPVHIVLIFWPQYLEYLGFITLFLTLAFLAAPHHHARRLHRHIVSKQGQLPRPKQ